MEKLTLTSERARLLVDLAAGGRMAALTVDGHELLVEPESDPVMWGAYPMIPFAGRLREGHFEFDGVSYTLPTNFAPHAIHGYGFLAAWDHIDDHTIGWTFRDPWPFAGSATQHFSLTDDSLTITLHTHATESQPMMLGVHPWFRRQTSAGELTFELPECSMYRRDTTGLPDGTLVTPPAGPWDDCFCQLESDPVLRWGDLEVRLSASSDHWVIYTEADHALCVEPQTGPPNAFNSAPHRLEAGDSLSLRFTMSW